MNEELAFFKLALKNLEYKNIFIDITDEIQVRFTYKKRNYLLHINTTYGMVILEQLYSLNQGEAKNDEMSLLTDIEAVIEYTRFEGYKVCYMSYFDVVENVMSLDIQTKMMQATRPDVKNIVTTVTKVKLLEDLEKGKLIENTDGFNSFDERIFEKNWLEDFDEKLDTYTEKDLFIVISTLSSYFYKLSNNLWEGEKVDPFVIEYACSKFIAKARKYDPKFERWYNYWNNYFKPDVLKEYLKEKNKNKQMS